MKIHHATEDQVKKAILLAGKSFKGNIKVRRLKYDKDGGIKTADLLLGVKDPTLPGRKNSTVGAACPHVYSKVLLAIYEMNEKMIAYIGYEQVSSRYRGGGLVSSRMTGYCNCP